MGHRGRPGIGTPGAILFLSLLIIAPPALADPFALTLTADPDRGLAPLVVRFHDTSPYSTDSTWSFGDGSTATGRDPVHTYHEPGTYQVRLTALSGMLEPLEKRTAVTTVVVESGVVAAFESTSAGDLAVRFTDTSTGEPTRWSWSFGDGTTSAEREPVHRYDHAGAYTVRLTATRPGDPIEGIPDTVGSVNRPVLVRPLLKPSFTYRLESGYHVHFVDTSSGEPTWWHWEFGDETTSAEQHPVHAYPGPGTYSVSLMVSSGGPERQVERTVVLPPEETPVSLPPPVAGFTAEPVVGEAPLTVRFTDTSTAGAAAWHWEFGDGATSIEQHPVHEYRDAGTYTVSLEVQDAAGSRTHATRSDLVRVEPPLGGGTETPSTETTTVAPVTPIDNGGDGGFPFPDWAGPLVLVMLAAAILVSLLPKRGRAPPGEELAAPSSAHRPPARVSIETRSGLVRSSPGASAPEVTITTRTGMTHDTTT